MRWALLLRILFLLLIAYHDMCQIQGVLSQTLGRLKSVFQGGSTIRVVEGSRKGYIGMNT